jgi:hypothetical protein
MYSDAEDDIDNINPTIPPLFGSNGQLDNGMESMGMKPHQSIPYGMNDDYFMRTNFSNNFNVGNIHQICYPMSNGENQCEPTFTELQSVRSEPMIGYGGGGSGAGMSDGVPYSGITNSMGNPSQSSIFTAQNGDYIY